MSPKAILAGTVKHEEAPALVEAPQMGMAPMLLSIPGGKYHISYCERSANENLVEIRNRIYHFAQEDGKIRCYDDRHNWEEQDGPYSILPKIPYQFLSLTQVCREIRHEFLPLYRARTVVCVQAHEVKNYINTVLAPADVEDEDVVGNVIIDLNACEGEKIEIDIKPLLQLLSKAKRLSVEAFEYDDFGVFFFKNIRALPHEVLNITNPTLFSYYLDEAICAVVLMRQPSWNYDPELILVVKAAYWKSWMRVYDLRCDELDNCRGVWHEVEKWALSSGVRPGCNCSLSMRTNRRLKFKCGK